MNATSRASNRDQKLALDCASLVDDQLRDLGVEERMKNSIRDADRFARQLAMLARSIEYAKRECDELRELEPSVGLLRYIRKLRDVRSAAQNFEPHFDAFMKEHRAAVDDGVESVIRSVLPWIKEQMPLLKEIYSAALATRVRDLLTEIANDEQPEDGLDLIYSKVDSWLRHSQFSRVDALVKQIDVEKVPVVHLLAIASVTSPAPRKALPSRTSFMGAIRNRLQRTDAPRVERLLAGLE